MPLLAGAEHTIVKHRPVLCLEFEPYVAGIEPCRQLLGWLSEFNYGGLRLIYANLRQSRAIVEQLARVWTAAELNEQLDQNAIGPYATLLAYPSRETTRR